MPWGANKVLANKEFDRRTSFTVLSAQRVLSTVNCGPCCNMQMFYFILSYFKTKQTRLPNESCKTWDWIQFIFRLAALTYRWARQASTRSSCCAAGPGSSEWLAPYPGSCWASPSTAPYLPRDKYARSSLILLSSRPPLTMRGQRFSDERERKKNPKKRRSVRKSERNVRLKVERSFRMQSWIGLWDPWCDFVNTKQMANARRAVFILRFHDVRKINPPRNCSILSFIIQTADRNKQRRLSVELGFQMFDLWTLPIRVEKKFRGTISRLQSSWTSTDLHTIHWRQFSTEKQLAKVFQF